MSRHDELIHGYDSVDHDILWDTIRYDLPSLLTAVDSLLQNDAEEQ